MEVTVEAPRGVDSFASGAAVTVMALDQRWSSGADLGQVLDTAAGLNVLRLGGLGDFSAVSIRGSSLRQVQVFLDGVPLNPDGSAVVNLSELPLSAFERVEVWRGNAPPELGAAPMGGVVNLITPDRPSQASAALALGTARTGRANLVGGASGRCGGRSCDALLLADGFTTGGNYSFFADNGTLFNTEDDTIKLRENNQRDQLTGHLRLRWGDSRLRVTGLSSGLLRWEGLPGHANAPARESSLATQRHLGALDLRLNGAQSQLSARLWQQHRRELLDDREGELGVGRSWDESLTDTWGLLISGSTTPNTLLLPSLTLSLRQDSYRARDLLLDQSEDPRRRRSATLSAGLRSTLIQGRLRLDPVVQLSALDNRLLGDVPFGDSPVSPETQDWILRADPRVSVAWVPNGAMTLRASAGRYLRPPDFTELFGDRGALVGNTDLVPETGWSVDAGLRLRSPWGMDLGGDLDLSVYHTRSHDLIVFMQNGQSTLRPSNVGEALVQGLELSLGLRWRRAVDSRSTLSLTRSVNLTPYSAAYGLQLPRVPMLSVNQVSTLTPGDRISAGHIWSFTGGNYWDTLNLYRSAPRSFHSAFVRAKPWPLGPSLELACLNLADRISEEVPRDPLNPSDPSTVVQAITDFNGYPLPGRTWMVSLRWEAARE